MNYLVTLINNYRAVTRHSPHHSPATKVRGLGKVIVNVALVYKMIPHTLQSCIPHISAL